MRLTRYAVAATAPLGVTAVQVLIPWLSEQVSGGDVIPYMILLPVDPDGKFVSQETMQEFTVSGGYIPNNAELLLYNQDGALLARPAGFEVNLYLEFFPEV